MSPPTTLTIVGLGPGEAAARSLATQRILDEAETIVLRTTIHPGTEFLQQDERVVACDDLYENHETFEDVYAAIVDRVLGLATEKAIVYAVPGSPSLGETTVQAVIDRAKRSDIEVRIVPSISAFEAISAAASIDLLTAQPQVIDALELARQDDDAPFSGSMLHVDPARVVIVMQVYDSHTASAVKERLSLVFPLDHRVTVVTAAGVSRLEHIEEIPLHQLDQVAVNHLTSVIVPPLPLLEASRSAATLHHLVAFLRSETGCPWDRKQTHATLRDKILEEAHEVIDAIDRDDPSDLAGELGDLLLLIALNAQIAEEAGTFTIEDVYASVNEKIVRRHPHVFGDAYAETADDVVKTWKAVKSSEKGEQADTVPALRYDQLPPSLSTLQRIRLAESAQIEGGDKSEPKAMLGDRLLALVQEAFDCGADPEQLLEAAYRRSKA